MNIEEILNEYPVEEDIYTQWERVYIDVDLLTEEDLLCENLKNEN